MSLIIFTITNIKFLSVSSNISHSWACFSLTAFDLSSGSHYPLSSCVYKFWILSCALVIMHYKDPGFYYIAFKSVSFCFRMHLNYELIFFCVGICSDKSVSVLLLVINECLNSKHGPFEILNTNLKCVTFLSNL